MINYVCGFIFTSDLSKVTLIKKNRPDWQKGKLNGIGGKIESTDISIPAAMARECKEETDILIDSADWTHFSMEQGDGWVCYFFYAVSDTEPKTMEDEEVAQYNVTDISTLSVIPNLKELIPNAITAMIEKTLSHDNPSDSRGKV